LEWQKSNDLRILGRMAKIVPRDRQWLCAHSVYWLETFIDPGRFKGPAIAP